MKKNIQEVLKERILIIDGAMGTMIQRHKLEEADYRGERFKDWHTDVMQHQSKRCLFSNAGKFGKLSYGIFKQGRRKNHPAKLIDPKRKVGVVV